MFTVTYATSRSLAPRSDRRRAIIHIKLFTGISRHVSLAAPAALVHASRAFVSHIVLT